MSLIPDTTRRSDGTTATSTSTPNAFRRATAIAYSSTSMPTRNKLMPDIEMSPVYETNPMQKKQTPNPPTTRVSNLTNHPSPGLFTLIFSLSSISEQILHGLRIFRVIALFMQVLWVLVVTTVPILLCISIRFLFAPSSSIGAVSIQSYQWYLACFVAIATIIYGFRFAMREYIKTRFSHRAQISVARAVANGDLINQSVVDIGHHIRGARRCVLEDIPTMFDGILETIIFTVISLTQSTSIGCGVVVVLVILVVTHVLDDALQTSSMQIIHNSCLDSSGNDPVAVVHKLAAETHTQSIYRAILITISTLVEFSSPLVFLWCCINEMTTVNANGGVVEEFNLFLSFISAVAAIVASKAAHTASRRALSKIHSVRAIVELDLGRDEQKGWNTNSTTATTKTSCCTARTGIIALLFIVVTATITILIATGSQVNNFGCKTVQIECVLGSNAAILNEKQTFDLATGCKIESDGPTLLEKCLVASAISSGYGEVSTESNNGTEIMNSASASSSSSSSNSNSQTIKYGNFTNEQVLKAAAGKTASSGGLNVGDIRTVLTLNNLETSGVRATLNEKLQTMLSNSNANNDNDANTGDTVSNGYQYVIDDENGDVDSSIRSVGQLLSDGKRTEVTLEVRYHNWLNEIETIRSSITWEEVAQVALQLNAENIQDIDEAQEDQENIEQNIEQNSNSPRRLSSSVSASIRNDITFSKRVTSSKNSGTTEYVFQIVVGDRRASGSKNTISVSLTGEYGSTKYVVLGDKWVEGEKREVKLSNMAEVGNVTAITLITSGKDGVLFEGLTVDHLETAVVFVSPSSSASSSSSAAAAPPSTTAEKKIDVGTKVAITTGKYMNCVGIVEKFSPSTGKPQVCRDCSKKNAGSNKKGACCSSSSCGYYQMATLKKVMEAIVASDSTENHDTTSAELLFDVDTDVKILSGKYIGCMGDITKFSPSTGKPNVCRNCDSKGSNDQDCCGSTKRSQCSYYKFENIERSIVETPKRELSSYFHMKTLLKCSGSKRKGTWSCQDTLKATRPLSKTIDANDAAGACPTKGQTGWQGDARIITSTTSSNSAIHGPLTYSFGTLWVDAEAKGVSKFEYIARQDCGRLNRHGSFKIDRSQKAIQQTTGRAYPKHCYAPKRGGKPWSLDGLSSSEIKDQCLSVSSYDRGHLIPANHFDDNTKTITETNYMINILPQVDKMNRGAWLETEMLIECLRDVEVLRVIGGAVYPPSTVISHGDTPAEFFRNSHGVVTPTHFWKLVATKADGLFAKDNGLIAFWMPNSVEAIAKNIDQYVVSITELENNLKNALGSKKRAGWPAESVPEIFDLPQSVKDHVPKYWGTLDGCDRS